MGLEKVSNTYICILYIQLCTSIDYADILLLKWIKQLTRLQRLEKDDYCICTGICAKVFLVTGKNITIGNVLTDNVTFYYFYHIVNSMPVLATSIWHKKWYLTNSRQTELRTPIYFWSALPSTIIQCKKLFCCCRTLSTANLHVCVYNNLLY